MDSMGMVKNSQSSQNRKFAMSFQYLKKKKKLNRKLTFFACRVSYKFISILWASNFPTRLILSLLMGMIKCSQITQSNKCSISLQYLQKEVRNGDPFWHADKRPVWLNGRVFVYEPSTVH